jgi:probable rRNA maturation factor
VNNYKVNIIDEQNDADLSLDFLKEFCYKILEFEEIKKDSELCVIFIDESSMKSLNERFMNKAGPTDVLSFPIDDPETYQVGRDGDFSSQGPGRATPEQNPPAMLGDIFICPSYVAREEKTDFDRQIAFLIVHGILHLFGMDHEIEADAAEMREKESELMNLFYPSDRFKIKR